MVNRGPFAADEWYHCFNRGIDKRDVFTDEHEHRRFLHLLYACNSNTPVHLSNLPKMSDEEIFMLPRGGQLVAVGAYCLMPNHFHLLLKPLGDGGITGFMRKVMTAYTMYFNIKHERTGNLLNKPFRSKHVYDDRYFQYVIRYIHCNPAELYEPGWKRGQVSDPTLLASNLRDYPYSSLSSFVKPRFDDPILHPCVLEAYEDPNVDDMIADAIEYGQEHSLSR